MSALRSVNGDGPQGRNQAAVTLRYVVQKSRQSRSSGVPSGGIPYLPRARRGDMGEGRRESSSDCEGRTDTARPHSGHWYQIDREPLRSWRIQSPSTWLSCPQFAQNNTDFRRRGPQLPGDGCEGAIPEGYATVE